MKINVNIDDVQLSNAENKTFELQQLRRKITDQMTHSLTNDSQLLRNLRTNTNHDVIGRAVTHQIHKAIKN